MTGWAGVARPESGIHVLKSCRACHWKKYSGLKDPDQLIDWHQWTGDDFFIVWPMPKLTLITGRVAEALLAINARSFVLKGVDDIDPLVSKHGFTVGSLSDYIPEDLATRYGGALGLE